MGKFKLEESPVGGIIVLIIWVAMLLSPFILL